MKTLKNLDKLKRLNINISLLLNFFSVVGVAQEGKLIDKVIAVIGNKAVLYSDLKQQLLQIEQGGTPVTSEIECEVLENLLFEKLLLNQADIDSVTVSEGQVNAELDNRIRYFESQVGSIKRIEEIFGKSILEIREDFFKKIENRLKTERVQATITENVTVNPKSIREFYNNAPKDSLPLVNVQVEIAHIVVQPQVSDKEKQNVKNQLAIWRDEIVAGTRTFATTAVFESDDPGTKSKGGEFDWVTRGEFVPEFDRMAFSMKEGEVSQVFETDYGYHILELYERRGDRYRGRHILRMPKVSSEELYKARNLCDSVLNLINTKAMTFEEAVVKFSTDKDTKYGRGLMFDQYSTSSKFDIDNIDRQLFLSIDGMKPGEVKGPFVMQTNDGKQAYRLVKLVSRTEPHRANMTDDYQLISNMALAEERQKALLKWVNNQLTTTFIKLDSQYKNCEFEFNWLTSNPN